MEIKANKFGKFPCACCGYYTLTEQPPNTFLICPVCNWEDDGVQFSDFNYDGGANTMSLNTAKSNFKKYKAIDEGLESFVRKPKFDEFPDE